MQPQHWPLPGKVNLPTQPLEVNKHTQSLLSFWHSNELQCVCQVYCHLSLGKTDQIFDTAQDFAKCMVLKFLVHC